MIILAVLVSVVVTVLCVVLFIATIGPVKRRFRIVRTASPSLSHQAAAAGKLRDEVDELAQFLKAWQRVTVDRLSGRVEQSKVTNAGLLAHVAELDAERIVVSLLDPSGLRHRRWTSGDRGVRTSERFTKPSGGALGQPVHRRLAL